MFWGQISVFKQIRARIMGFSTLMGNLGLRCHCLSQIGAKSAFFGPGWGLEVKKWRFWSTRWVIWGQISIFLAQIEARRSDFLCPEVGGWFGLKCLCLTQIRAKSAFFGLGWGLEDKKWRFSSTRWVIWGQISVFLAQIESRRSDFLCPEVGGWFGLKCPFFDPNWGQICFF